MNALDPTIYRGFVPLPPDLHGWHGTSPVFGKLIDQTRPTRIIEVGTWKGQSAITMGAHVKKAGLKCTVTCVDTWLGAQEFWGPQADRPHPRRGPDGHGVRRRRGVVVPAGGGLPDRQPRPVEVRTRRKPIRIL